MTTPPLSDQFKLVDSQTPNLGMSDSAFWIRFTVKTEPGPGDSPTPQKWLLDVDWPFPLFTQFYIPSAARDTGGSSKGWIVEEVGTPAGASPGRSHRKLPFFRLPNDLEKPVTCYLRLQGASDILLPLNIYQDDAYFDVFLVKKTWKSINYGVIFSMAAFNLFLFISLRSRSYLWYVLYLLSFAVYVYGLIDSTFLGFIGPHEFMRHGRVVLFFGGDIFRLPGYVHPIIPGHKTKLSPGRQGTGHLFGLMPDTCGVESVW